MTSQITGRPLDDAGKPTAGPALEIDPEGRAMELFRAMDEQYLRDRFWESNVEQPDI